VAERKEIVVILDWTDFEKDDHATLAIHMVTTHGRSTPLIWKTARKSGLAGNQTLIERVLVGRLRELVAPDVKITLLADRGFGSCEFYEFLSANNVDYVIRFRENIKVSDVAGETKTAAAWVPTTGKPKTIRNATVTGSKQHVPVVVCVRTPKMKDAWCLASSIHGVPASTIVKLYGRRFTIEERFRDTKDIRFGMGLSATSTTSPDRRDRLLLIGALAQALLTLLGAAGESLGMDRMLKVNTVKRRTHSLYTQGYHYYRTIPAMGLEALRPLAEKFGDLIRDQSLFRQIFGVI